MSGSVKSTLHELGVKPSKEFGQNFLIDSHVIDTIVEFGRPKAGEKLVEIGPGLGALTSELSRVGDLTVIEYEERFCKALRKQFPNITVLHQDFRSVDLGEIGKELVVFGNLPYSFSTEIIFHLVAFAPNLKRAILVLQKEFAERMAAEPGSRTYGALSVNCQLWADMRTGAVIPGSSFHPPTAVDSLMIELRFLKEPRFEVKDTYFFQRTVSAAFFKKRKKIINSMVASRIFPEIDLGAVLGEAGIDPGRRAETVSVEEFVRLADLLATSK